MVSISKKIIFSILFIVIFSASSVFAYSGGEGTSLNPYQLVTVADFMQLSNTPADWNKAFIMTADIDLAAEIEKQIALQLR